MGPLACGVQVERQDRARRGEADQLPACPDLLNVNTHRHGVRNAPARGREKMKNIQRNGKPSDHKNEHRNEWPWARCLLIIRSVSAQRSKMNRGATRAIVANDITSTRLLIALVEQRIAETREALLEAQQALARCSVHVASVHPRRK
jgi:hypothetical protein